MRLIAQIKPRFYVPVNGTHNIRAYVSEDQFELVKHSYWVYNKDARDPHVYQNDITDGTVRLDRFILRNVLRRENIDGLANITHLDSDPLNCETSNLHIDPEPSVYQSILSEEDGKQIRVTTTSSANDCWEDNKWILKSDGSITGFGGKGNLYLSILCLGSVPGVSIGVIDGNKLNCRPNNLLVTHGNISIRITTTMTSSSAIPMMQTSPDSYSYPSQFITEYKTVISSRHYISVMNCNWKYDPSNDPGNNLGTSNEPISLEHRMTLSEYIIALMIGHAVQPIHLDGDISNNTPENLSIPYDPLAVVDKWRRRWINNTICTMLYEMHRGEYINTSEMGKKNIFRFILQLTDLPTPVVGSIKCHAKCSEKGTCARSTKGCCNDMLFALIDEMVQARLTIGVMSSYFQSTDVIGPLVKIIAQYITGEIDSPRLDGSNLVSLLSSDYLMTPLEYKTMGNTRMRLLYDLWMTMQDSYSYSWHTENRAIINPGRLRLLDEGARMIIAAGRDELIKSTGANGVTDVAGMLEKYQWIEPTDIINAAIRKYCKLPETECMDIIELMVKLARPINRREFHQAIDILEKGDLEQ